MYRLMYYTEMHSIPLPANIIRITCKRMSYVRAIHANSSIQTNDVKLLQTLIRLFVRFDMYCSEVCLSHTCTSMFCYFMTDQIVIERITIELHLTTYKIHNIIPKKIFIGVIYV